MISNFIKKIVLFLVPFFLTLPAGLLFPPTPRASTSLLFANVKKDSLLEHTKAPRLILLGGSNLSFGIDSYLIKNSLGYNPINTAVHASIGAKYMLENTIRFVDEGDVIIISFEYEHFFRPYDFTSEELFRTIFDVFPHKFKRVSYRQMFNFISYVPKYTLSKINPTEYYGFQESDIYSVNSFNDFGDVDAHWDMKSKGYTPTSISGELNEIVISKIIQFQDSVIQRDGSVYITFPCLDEVSFSRSKESVLLIESALRESGLSVLGNAERYVMPEHMMFNTPYHLNKEGVDCRTQLFIEDFKKRAN